LVYYQNIGNFKVFLRELAPVRESRE